MVEPALLPAGNAASGYGRGDGSILKKTDARQGYGDHGRPGRAERDAVRHHAGDNLDSHAPGVGPGGVGMTPQILHGGRAAVTDGRHLRREPVNADAHERAVASVAPFPLDASRHAAKARQDQVDFEKQAIGSHPAAVERGAR